MSDKNVKVVDLIFKTFKMRISDFLKYMTILHETNDKK